MGRAASTAVATALAVAACACAAQPPAGADGVPHQADGAGQRGSADQASAAPREWARMAEVRAWPPANDEPFVALGHPPGDQLAQVHVSPDAREPYLSLLPGETLPVGAVVVELQQDPNSGQPGLGYVMTKVDDGRWEFMLVRADGRILEQGQLPACARCHAEAPADSLFGVPAGD